MMKDFTEPQLALNLAEILGIPKRGIIFSDLDGVWFDESNNFAFPDPKDLVILQEAQDAGYWIVLNSDTGSEALATFAKNLGANPLVIAENGAVVYLSQQGIKEYFSPFKPFFSDFRQEVVLTLMKKYPQAAIFYGDATAFIQAEGSLPGSNPLAFLVNAARECSLGIYTRLKDENDKLTVSDLQTQETETTLKFLLGNRPERDLLICKNYPLIGSCLVKDPKQTKWQAVNRLINQFPPTLSFYMIGDALADSMEPITEKVTTCAVGNANNDLKTVARKTGGIVAPENLTIAKGANYIVQQILKGGENAQ